MLSIIICFLEVTLSSRVPQHGVGHHHYGPLEHMSQDKDVKLLQTLIHGFIRGLGPASNKDKDRAPGKSEAALFIQLQKNSR